MIVEVEAVVTYSCWLNKEQEKMVKDYAEEHDCELIEAVEELYSDSDVDFDLYKESSESDFRTENFLNVEENDG